MILTGNQRFPIPDGLLAEAVVRSPEARSLRYEGVPDFGIRKNSERKPRTLTDEQVSDFIGKEESAIFNFIIMMLEGISIQEISEWICRCKQRNPKPKEYRTYTRKMEQAMSRYLEATIHYWGDSFDTYAHYFNKALEEVAAMRAVHVHIGMDNEIYKQLPRDKDRETARQLCFTAELLKKSREVAEKKKSALVEATGAKLIFTADPDMKAIEKACKAIVDTCHEMQRDFGLEIEVTKPIADIVGAFLNRMGCFCRRLLEEEREELEAYNRQQLEIQS